jgi:hypothetical protein
MVRIIFKKICGSNSMMITRTPPGPRPLIGCSTFKSFSQRPYSKMIAHLGEAWYNTLIGLHREEKLAI